MTSKIKVDAIEPQSGTALTVGASGDTLTVPSGATLTTTSATVNLPATTTVTTELKTNKISPASGTAFTLGDSGDTFTIPAGATIANSGTATGFGGGAYTKILHTTASSSANLAFNSTYLTSTYQDYKIVFSNVHCATDAQRFFAEFSADNGSNFKALDLNVLGRKDDGSQIHSKNSNDGSEANLQLQMNEDIGNDAGLHISGEIDIFDPSGTDNRKLILGRSGSNVGDSALAFFYSFFGAMTKDTDAINYVKFSWGSGNIASGEFTLYGRKIT